MLLNRIHSSFALNQVPFRSNNSPISANHVCPECNHSYNLERQPNVDSFEKINSVNDQNQVEIGVVRLATGFLTDEQIAEINKTGKLPNNAKFVANQYGQYMIANNFFNITPGTQTLPAGLEVKKNVIGQAIVVAKDTNGLLIK